MTLVVRGHPPPPFGDSAKAKHRLATSSQMSRVEEAKDAAN